jgi:hypothetical protein
LTAPQRPWWRDRDDCEDAPPVVLDVVGLAHVPENDADDKTVLAFSVDSCEKARERPELSPRSAPTPKGAT